MLVRLDQERESGERFVEVVLDSSELRIAVESSESQSHSGGFLPMQTHATHPQYRLEEVVERAYSAYVSSQSGVNQHGQRHEPWQALRAEEKAGWMAAINTAIAIAEGRQVTDQHALRQAELRGEVPDSKRPGGQVPDEEEENAKTSAKSKDDGHATSKKAHASGR